MQFHFTRDEGTNAQFWSLEINKDRNGPLHFFLNGANFGDECDLVGLRPVAHINAERVRPRTVELFDHSRRVAGRAKRG